MVTDGPGRQTIEGRPVVAFDFDGTLTTHDSFMAFLRWRAGPVRFALGMVQLLPATVAYLGHRDRGRIKAAAVGVFLRGLTRAELEASARDFAARTWDGFMRPDALATWRDWQEKGAVMTIVTASPEEVVAPFARRLGAEVLLGTRLSCDAEGRIDGAFVGENCRALEKVVRLEQRFGPNLRLAAAYGDTSGDREMLAIAEAPGFRVFTGHP
jgi:phosphatidylglycerophosphatase C